MASRKEREDFNLAGPTYLTSINWSCLKEQGIVVACLIRGVYILERDRQQNRRGSDALAPTWWEHFNFRLIRQFQDDFDSSISGAVYEYTQNDPAAPKYIFAFRGTIKERQTIVRDVILNFRLLMSSLHKSSRYMKALEALSTLTAVVGDENVWIGGHSLGASLATLAGKHFAKNGIHLKSFLFNPPFVTSPVEMLPGLNEKMKERIRGAKEGIRHRVSSIIKRHEAKSAESFEILASWVPIVFLNSGDPICSEYVNYFQQRKTEVEQGGDEKRVASHLSVRDMCWNLLGVDSERLYLFPSAQVMVNKSSADGWKRSHEIDQWWQPDLDLETCYLCQ